MKSARRVIVALLIVLGIGALQANVAKADSTEYGKSDIARIYIQCDTDIMDLKKNDTTDQKTGQVTKAYQTATITVVDKDGNVSISDDQASVKLRGNSSSLADKRPLKIKFSKKQSLLGMDTGKKWNLLANAFDKTLIRNKLCYDLAADMGLAYTVQSDFVDLYYNGELMGSYLVTEPVETGDGRVEIGDDENTSDFMIERENERYEEGVTYFKTGNGIRFAVNSPETPTDTQLTGIKNYTSKLETALKTYKYSEYSKYIDVDSFVNYYVISEIFKAVDFNYSSTRFYVKDGKMYAGPIWDVDLSSGNAAYNYYTGYDNNGKSYEKLFCTEFAWYGYLIKSDEFVAKVNARLKEMLPRIENMYKSNSLGNNQIDNLYKLYGSSFERNYASKENGGAGWSLTYRYSTCDNWKGLEYSYPSDTYSGNVEFLRSWLEKRVTYLKSEWAGIKNNKMSSVKVTAVGNKSATLSFYSRGVSEGYEVYVKTAGDNYKLAKTVTGTTVTIGNLKKGLTYKFKVRSFTKAGTTKVYTDFLEATDTVKIALPRPKITELRAKGNNLTIRWTKVAAAKGYVIYIKQGNGKLKAVKTVTANKARKYIYTKYNSKKTIQVKIRSYVLYKGKKYFSEY